MGKWKRIGISKSFCHEDHENTRKSSEIDRSEIFSNNRKKIEEHVERLSARRHQKIENKHGAKIYRKKIAKEVK